MSKPSFVYVTYIKTSADKVWRAITEGDVTHQYWSNHRNASDWKAGSTWRHEDFDDANIVDVVGTVVESTPPRKLVITWADPKEAADPAKRSRVTFEIVEDAGLVRLTVTHDELEAGSNMLRAISQGWPLVLSGLKTLLETGDTMPDVKVRQDGHWTDVRFNFSR